MLRVVAIVGRENVGKSTLFNRLVGGRPAVIHREPGITRDRNIKEINLYGTQIFLVDTGGYWPYESEGIKAKVKEQVHISLETADLILFMVDAKSGITSLDSEIASLIRKLNKKVVLMVNKVDTEQKKYEATEFHSLGFSEIVNISALHGIGIDALVDLIKEKVAQEFIPPKEKKVPNFAILGRSNVGKSTYINAILKQPRIIVDEKPGTTIDSIDVTLNYEGQEVTLIDTPGIRKRTKIKSDVEYYSSVRTKLTISRCDVAILILDATLPLTRQDKRIIATLIEEGKGIVLAANKIDLGVGFREGALRFGTFIPVTYISALNQERVYEPIKEALKVWDARRQRISKRKLSEFRERSKLKVSSIVQIGVEPPEFKIKLRRPLTPQAERFIKRKLRTSFGFIGVPIKIHNSR